jgi:hypothetical protein
MNTKFYGTDFGRTTNGGGSVRMTISSNVAQGNAGVSLPCKKCFIIASAGTVRVDIGTACTADTGIPVPWLDAANHVWDVLEIPIDDVSKLYFYGSGGTETIDCLYFT